MCQGRQSAKLLRSGSFGVEAAPVRPTPGRLSRILESRPIAARFRPGPCVAKGPTRLVRVMPPPRYAIRLDPWAAEYEGSIQLPDDGDEPGGAVDLRVERND